MACCPSCGAACAASAASCAACGAAITAATIAASRREENGAGSAPSGFRKKGLLLIAFGLALIVVALFVVGSYAK
jgi:uncharacterized membrane protein YvbJ